MDTNNRRPNQSTEANMDSSDWRSGMQHETRQRIVSKIMDMLKRHLPVSGQEGMHQLWKIAQWFEDKCFNTTTSQAAYLRKISIKMLVLEARYKGTTANDMPPNQGGLSNKPFCSVLFSCLIAILLLINWFGRYNTEHRQYSTAKEAQERDVAKDLILFGASEKKNSNNLAKVRIDQQNQGIISFSDSILPDCGLEGLKAIFTTAVLVSKPHCHSLLSSIDTAKVTAIRAPHDRHKTCRMTSHLKCGKLVSFYIYEIQGMVEEEADCRICLLELRGADTLKKECSCKGELALVHQECAVKWFSIKGNRTCDVCKREVRNLPVSIVYK
ncbi:Mediator of RNA polymerase II transcription subunit 15a, partial [Mucuna pruriens]